MDMGVWKWPYGYACMDIGPPPPSPPPPPPPPQPPPPPPQDNNNQGINIYIKIPMEKSWITKRIKNQNKHIKTKDLKDMIQKEMTDIPTDFYITHQGTIPQEHQTLHEIGINNQSTITINWRMRGGMNRTNEKKIYNVDSIKKIPEEGKLAEMKYQVLIPEDNNEITNSAFQYAEGLTNVHIPDNIQTIKEYAFISCTNMESIILPNSITKIERNAFEGCYKITEITIPKQVTTIATTTFAKCINLQKIILHENIQNIEDHAFSECTSLKTIQFPERLTTISQAIMEKCRSLTEITLPMNLKKIEKEAFLRCSGIQHITIPEGVTIIGQSAFKYCTNLKTISLPKSIKIIGPQAFLACHKLEQINIPDETESIGAEAFQRCDNLARVKMGNKLTTIKNGTFKMCTRLTTINIPESITNIEEYAFKGCTQLKHITLPQNQKQICSTNTNEHKGYTFDGCTNLEIVIANQSITTYRTDIPHDRHEDINQKIENTHFTNCPRLKQGIMINSNQTEMKISKLNFWTKESHKRQPKDIQIQVYELMIITTRLNNQNKQNTNEQTNKDKPIRKIKTLPNLMWITILQYMDIR
jgi:hypothetical protein